MYRPTHSPKSVNLASCLGLLALMLPFSQASAGTPVSGKDTVAKLEAAVDWKDHTISPVSDPILFEDAIIRTEIRPVAGFQRIDDDFITQGGDLQIYGIQLRYAVTDRLALIGTKGGYMEVQPEVGPDLGGWANVSVGAKYALIDDKDNAFILTPGLTYDIPLGEEEIFNGTGDGIFNAFVSTQKGFGDFHIQANAGLLIPVDDEANSTILHYHLQADYYVCRLFIPFVVAHGYSVVSEGNAIPLGSEGYDIVNFGSSRADSVTQVVVGAGFRSRLTDSVDFGFAYEKAVATPEGLLDDRFTVDFSIRF